MFGIQIRLDKHANKQKNTTHDEEKNQQIRSTQRYYTADKMIDMKQFL